MEKVQTKQKERAKEKSNKPKIDYYKDNRQYLFM